MIARVALVMATYVAVGLLLAAPAMVPATDDVSMSAQTQPQAAAAIATDPESPSTTTTDPESPSTSVYSKSGSTVPWDSGRLAEGSEPGLVPIAIDAPSIGVRAEVVDSGIDPDSGQMAIPPEARQVGWYRYGPTPGEEGSAVLAGHVDMAGQGPGAFYHLDRLSPGDEVTITMSDGSARTFEVVETSRVPKTELDVDAVFENAGPSRVTLVTCGGAFNHTERTYLDNVVSVLRPVGASA